MLLSMSDMAFLLILRWCQYGESTDFQNLCSETDIINLLEMGLLTRRQGGNTLLLTGRGHSLLDETIDNLAPKTAQTYHADAINRRIHLSRLMLTAYRAGLAVFLTRLEELSAPPAFFLPAIARGRGRNPWGNTRIAGLAALGGQLCAVHYVGPGIGKLLLSDELGAFSNNTAILPQEHRALIFAGDTYAAVLTELEETGRTTTDRLIPYGEAYRRCPLPVYLLSSDETGVQQLRIMARPDYRSLLTRAALRGQYQPPPEGADCDALFGGAPFYLAVDMELRRLDRACRREKEYGGKPPVIAALEGQADALLYQRYRGTGLARVFTLTADTLADFLGPDPVPPAHRPFLTPKGDVIHAPPVRTHKTAGKGRGKK